MDWTFSLLSQNSADLVFQCLKEGFQTLPPDEDREADPPGSQEDTFTSYEEAPVGLSRNEI